MEKRIVCYGDSNTWGYTPITGERYPKGVRWTSIVAEETGYTVIEEGLNGRTSAFDNQLIPNLNGAKYIEVCAASQAPVDLFVFMLGTNDVIVHVCNNAHASATGVEVVAKKALAMVPGAKVLIVAPVPIGAFRPELGEMLELDMKSLENSAKLTRFLREMASLNGWEFLAAEDFAEVSRKDAVHLEPESHRKLGLAIAAKVKEMLG